ncbi:MAG TPA: MCE family protein [Mycobacterium sp.]
MTGSRNTIIKFGIFAVIMVVLTALLFATFAQVRTGSTSGYSAIFKDASRLVKGDTVRVAGIRVGTVRDVQLLADRQVQVDFDADKSIVLTTGTKAAIRYLNLVGDRYLELVDSPGSTRILSAGSQIPVDRTSPALDLDMLLGGLKPVLQGLNPQDVNALTSALVEIFQGQGDTLQSLMTRTSSFSSALADNNQVIEALIDNLRTVVGTLGDNGKEFSNAVDRFEKVVSSFAQDRDPIATAITSLDSGTASLADLLTQARPPLSGTVDQLNRLAPLLVAGKDSLDAGIQRMPGNYRKLARLGAYGSFIQYYICGITLRVTDLQGRTAVFPWIKQTTGRCAEPDA